MTIGIAASGPWAGAGILAGLRAVEAVGRGAIGGFVSLAVLTVDGRLVRAETQRDGTKGLFTNAPPQEVLTAPLAALISSGPDRPTPLSQFVAAAPGVGIVTGHRFPHVVTEDGNALNALVLAAMESGSAPQAAIDEVVAAHPEFDAGFVALSADGALGLGNMPAVRRLMNRGALVQQGADTRIGVATLHNAIHPNKAIAPLSNEVALDEMQRRVTKVQTISLLAGTNLKPGDDAEIHVGREFKIERVTHPIAPTTTSETSFGVGDRVRVFQFGEPIGWLGSEPFMIVRNGVIESLDGEREIHVPVLLDDD
ncbi:MAG: DUF6963 family protein [Paracoccaceae bacterium]